MAVEAKADDPKQTSRLIKVFANQPLNTELRLWESEDKMTEHKIDK